MNGTPKWSDPIRWKEPVLAVALKRYCEANPQRFNVFSDLARVVGYLHDLEGTLEELQLLSTEMITLPQFGPAHVAFLKKFLQSYTKETPSRYELDQGTSKPSNYVSE